MNTTAFCGHCVRAAVTASALAALPMALAQPSAPALPGLAGKPADAAKISGWRLDPALQVSVRAVSAEAAVREEDETIDGDAVAVRLTPSISLENDDVAFTLRNATTRLEFRDEDRTDRWQNTARLSGRAALGRSSALTLFGERSDNILATEFTLTDEWEFGGEIEHAIDGANRVQLAASWRERSYDDDERSTGQGPRIDGEYRHRFGANHFAYLRGRYEDIDSDNPRRRIDRWSATLSYQRPIARDLRVRPEITYQRLDFPGRQLETGGFRRDRVLTPELTLIYSPGPWRFSTEARYILRNSTDPQFDRSGYRLAVEISHEF